MAKAKNVGIKDIARYAQVSIGTVDRVLHNRGGVAESTRARVKQMLKDYDYKPNIIASRLKLASHQKIRLVALLPKLPRNANYWRLHIKGALRALSELEEHGVELEIYQFTYLNPRSYRKMLTKVLATDFDGLLTVPFYDREVQELIQLSRQSERPIAFLDTNMPYDFPGCSTYQDAVEAGQVAGRLMHTLRPNLQKVFVFQTSRNGRINSNSLQRTDGFLDFYATKVCSSHLKFEILKHELESERKLPETISELVNESEDFGIFVTNSRAHLVVDHLQNNNLDVPLIGFDLDVRNINWMKEGKIHFLINQMPEFQSYKSVKQLHQYITNRALPTAERIRIPVEIVIPENLQFYHKKNSFAT